MFKLYRHDIKLICSKKTKILFALPLIFYSPALAMLVMNGAKDFISGFIQSFFLMILLPGMVIVLFVAVNDLKYGTMQIKLLKGYSIEKCIAARLIILTIFPYLIIITPILMGLMFLFVIQTRFEPEVVAILFVFEPNVIIENMTILMYSLIPFSFFFVLTYVAYYFIRNPPVIFCCLIVYVIVGALMGETPYPISDKAMPELLSTFFFIINYADFSNFSEHIYVMSRRLGISPWSLFALGQILQLLKMFSMFILLRFRLKGKDSIDVLGGE